MISCVQWTTQRWPFASKNVLISLLYLVTRLFLIYVQYCYWKTIGIIQQLQCKQLNCILICDVKCFMHCKFIIQMSEYRTVRFSSCMAHWSTITWRIAAYLTTDYYTSCYNIHQVVQSLWVLTIGIILRHRNIYRCINYSTVTVYLLKCKKIRLLPYRFIFAAGWDRTKKLRSN